MADKKTEFDENLHWYKDAIIYELHIKAFRDSSGDGIGDFEGLLEKLDYLEDLGVTAIWVLPFYPSPLRDDGYDIADYYSINSSYGNISQFKRLLKEAHKRNLKVITELVINHCSDQHPWFQRARKAPKGSPERDYFVWSDDPTRYKDVRIIFQDFEVSNWTWDGVAQQYYWHRFFHHQPDLNYDNPRVQEEVFKIIDYWCKLGVDGFRLDAVPYLFEREGTNGENLPETHAYLKKLRQHVDEYFPGTVLLAEANMWPEDSASYFGNGDECHMNYHFPVMPRMFMALQMENRYPITDIFDQTPDIPDTCQWAIFLRNHDELTLEMVTDEERDYMYKVYAKDPKARINLGIRHRLGPLMENNRRKIELMNCLLFSLSGTPVIYYGDEIGMGDNYYLGDRDGVRTPMQWSPDRNAGFSEANPQRLYLPVILDPEYHYESVNVETQRRNPSSLLWFMKRIISMRKRFKAFSRGDMKFLNLDNPKVLAFTRSYGDEIILVIVNLSRYAQPAEIDLHEYKGMTPVEVFSQNSFPMVKEDVPYFFTLSPYAYDWYELKKTPETELVSSELPVLEISKWKELLLNHSRDQLQTIIPRYLHSTTWFEGRLKIVRSFSVIHHVYMPIEDDHAYILLVEVGYEAGLPQVYHLPLLFAKGMEADYMQQHHPQGMMARLIVDGKEGYLCDAVYLPRYQKALLSRIAKGQSIELKDQEVYFNGSRDVKKFGKSDADTRPKWLSSGKNRTIIAFDNHYIIKIYRLVDKSVNPDIEITRYLTEDTRFNHTPKFKGLIEWRLPNANIALAMVQDMVENNINGRQYMLERVKDFYERLQAYGKQLPDTSVKGVYSYPLGYEKLSPLLQEVLGLQVADSCRLLGERMAEMHLALSTNPTEKDFVPEEFSLHYQRSLYAGFLTLVRGTYQTGSQKIANVPAIFRADAENVFARRDEVLNRMKRIYHNKMDTWKIRIHGNFNLEQVLFTGKDLMFLGFAGDPLRSYSERRLKRSPLRDVAGIVRSFYYAAYEGIWMNNEYHVDDVNKLFNAADLWAYYASGIFVKSYLDKVQHTELVPENKEDMYILLNTYLMEKTLQSLQSEILYRPEWSGVPIRLMKKMIDQ